MSGVIEVPSRIVLIINDGMGTRAFTDKILIRNNGKYFDDIEKMIMRDFSSWGGYSYVHIIPFKKHFKNYEDHALRYFLEHPKIYDLSEMGNIRKVDQVKFNPYSSGRITAEDSHLLESFKQDEKKYNIEIAFMVSPLLKLRGHNVADVIQSQSFQELLIYDSL